MQQKTLTDSTDLCHPEPLESLRNMLILVRIHLWCVSLSKSSQGVLVQNMFKSMRSPARIPCVTQHDTNVCKCTCSHTPSTCLKLNWPSKVVTAMATKEPWTSRTQKQETEFGEDSEDLRLSASVDF